jgi:DNA-binding NarL/FixJ family response regulator
VFQNDADVVLVDASLGDHDSHGLVQDILEARAESRVVVMDIVSDPEDVIRFVRGERRASF